MEDKLMLRKESIHLEILFQIKGGLNVHFYTAKRFYLG